MYNFRSRSSSRSSSRSRFSILSKINSKVLQSSEVDDIGGKNEIIYYDQTVKKAHLLRTIDFSTDVLQYLIKNSKLKVNMQTTNSTSVLSLSVNDSSIPIIQSSLIEHKYVDNLIIQITIKNILSESAASRK